MIIPYRGATTASSFIWASGTPTIGIPGMNLHIMKERAAKTVNSATFFADNSTLAKQFHLVHFW
jgi:hypothetical protein